MNRAQPKSDKRHENLFFVVMAVAMTLVVFIGFARSFFFSFLWDEHDPNASTEPVFYVHGTIFATWMAFAVAQPILVRIRRIKWHRQVGRVGAALAMLIVLVGVYVLLLAAARSASSTPPPLPFDLFGVLVSGLMMFGILVGLAIAFRRDSQFHKRFMYLATINLLQAAIVRIPLGVIYNAGPATTFLLAYAFIVPLVVWDVCVSHRIHPATLWGGSGIVASLPLRMWLSSTEQWLAVAQVAVQLVK